MERREELKRELLRMLEEEQDFRYAVAGLLGFREILQRIDENIRAIRSLQEQVRSMQIHFNALGARWDALFKEVFRGEMRGIIEEILGTGEVRRWENYDEEGIVYGFPAVVETDLVIRDEEHILVDVRPSIARSDVAEFFRIGRLYEKKVGVKPTLVMISPYVSERAEDLARNLGIKIYSSV